MKIELFWEFSLHCQVGGDINAMSMLCVCVTHRLIKKERLELVQYLHLHRALIALEYSGFFSY